MKTLREGLALVSVIVAATIVGIAVSMAATALIGGVRVSQQAAHFTTASSFAEGVLERVRAQPFGPISSGPVTEALPRLAGAQCRIGVTPRGPGLKEVIVTCSWSERGQARSVRLATLIAKGGVR